MGVIGVEHLVTTTLMPGTVNTTEEIPWVETTLAGGFRVWQVLFLAGAVVLSGGKFQEIKKKKNKLIIQIT